MRRRHAAHASALAALMAGLALAAPPARAESEVTFVTWGGNIADEMKEAWFEPATEGMDVVILEDSLKGSNDVIAHVAAGDVYWDIVDGSGDMCVRAGKAGAAEELDYAVIKTDGIPESQVTPWSLPSTAYATVLAYNKKTYPNDPPSSWKDFFDVEKYPGKRWLSSFPTFNLEIALLADGVPPDQLYPLDVERAFKKLAELKPSIGGFYSSGGASTQHAIDGEPDMMPMYENRLFAAQREGADFGFTYNQAIMDFDCLHVPKGSKNKELAMRIIDRIMSPEINGRIAVTSGLSPGNLKSLDQGYIPEETLDNLAVAPQNIDKIIMKDNNWWADHRVEMGERYNAYKAE